MQVHACQAGLTTPLPDTRDQALQLSRVPHTGGIRKTHLGHTEPEHTLCHINDKGFIHRPLNRATESGREAHFEVGTLRFRYLINQRLTGRNLFKHLSVIAAYIFYAVGFAQRQGNRNFVGTRLQSRIAASCIGHQHCDHQILMTARAPDDFSGVGHLWK